MTNLQRVLTSRFGSLEIDVVQTGQSEPGITRRQLGEMLGYENPSRAIKDIHVRNANRFKGGAKCAQLKVQADDGKYYDTFIYSFKGIMEICRYSNQPNANAVMDWAWENLDRLRKGEIPVRPDVFNRLQERIDRLEDENYQLWQRVNGLKIGHGSFQLWDVAQQLRKNGIGNGNVHQTLSMMIDNGLLLKDVSIKKRAFYRPFLKDIRLGYFDHELTNNGQPVPVWQSQITVTAKGLDWIIQTFLSLRNRKWEQERPMIQYSRAVQCRLAEIPPEAGGRIIVSDELGNMWKLHNSHHSPRERCAPATFKHNHERTIIMTCDQIDKGQISLLRLFIAKTDNPVLRQHYESTIAAIEKTMAKRQARRAKQPAIRYTVTGRRLYN